MSVPVVFKDPETGNIVEVVEAKPVTVEEIDSRIAEAQQHIDHFTAKIADLNALKDKVSSFNNPQPAQPEAPAEPEQPQADTPAPQVPNSGPLEMGQQPPISA